MSCNTMMCFTLVVLQCLGSALTICRSFSLPLLQQVDRMVAGLVAIVNTADALEAMSVEDFGSAVMPRKSVGVHPCKSP